jgi:hypothetical protein
VLVPFKVNGIQQVFHVDPPIVTAPAATNGPRTALGDTQIYNFTLTTQDVGLPEKVSFGIGPLVAVPTATSTNFGPDSLHGGAAGAITGSTPAQMRLTSNACLVDTQALQLLVGLIATPLRYATRMNRS